ncbi:MAG: L-ribulose-5-phosphate 3-epimerase [Alphaproteobacteria bacterium]
MPVFGIYEKALPKNISWKQRLEAAKKCGFDYVEISIDESDERLARLDWSKQERLQIIQDKLDTGVGIHSMCLSGHRRFAFGSQNKQNEQRAKDIMEKAIELSYDIGIRNIQLAGYDVYPDYEPRSEATREQFIEHLKWAVKMAAEAQVMLSVEIMDTEFMSSIYRWKEYDTIIASPWFTVYPDVGNLSAWNDDVDTQLSLGIDKITAIHLKDTYKVTQTSKGQFRDVPFGEGCVDFVQVFRALKKLNYRGSFVLEQWSENAAYPLEEVIKSKEWMLQKMQQAEYM